MRAVEFITERININWIRAWVLRSAIGQIPENANARKEWYAKLFKKLKADKEFKGWAKQKVKGPIDLLPILKADEIEKRVVLQAEHNTYDPIEHDITVDINIVPTIGLDQLVDQLSARLAHEMAHAEQMSSQLNKTKDQNAVFDRSHSLFKGTPPAPRNETEKYYQYILNSLEHDAWIAEVATSIKNVLGDESPKYLRGILQQAHTQEYAVVKSKIIQVPGLNALFRAVKHYRGSLKYSYEQIMRKLVKELYGYLTR